MRICAAEVRTQVRTEGQMTSESNEIERANKRREALVQRMRTMGKRSGEARRRKAAARERGRQLEELAAALRALTPEELAGVMAAIDVSQDRRSPVASTAPTASSTHVQDAPPQAVPDHAAYPPGVSAFDYAQLEEIRRQRREMGLPTPSRGDPYDVDAAYEEEMDEWRRERDMRRAELGLGPFTKEF
jgi:hypothetical protein